jgi:hypothetical protein
MPGRKIRDRADAEACLAAAASSGLARVVWARNNGMDARSLNAWRLTLDRESHRGVRLVELVASARVDPTRYVVRVGDLEIEVDERFDDDVLRRLIAVAASC